MQEASAPFLALCDLPNFSKYWPWNSPWPDGCDLQTKNKKKNKKKRNRTQETGLKNRKPPGAITPIPGYAWCFLPSGVDVLPEGIIWTRKQMPWIWPIGAAGSLLADFCLTEIYLDSSDQLVWAGMKLWIFRNEKEKIRLIFIQRN